MRRCWMKLDKIHWSDLHRIPWKSEQEKAEGERKILCDKINELVDVVNKESTLEYLVRYYKGWD